MIDIKPEPTNKRIELYDFLREHDLRVNVTCYYDVRGNKCYKAVLNDCWVPFGLSKDTLISVGSTVRSALEELCVNINTYKHINKKGPQNKSIKIPIDDCIVYDCHIYAIE